MLTRILGGLVQLWREAVLPRRSVLAVDGRRGDRIVLRDLLDKALLALGLLRMEAARPVERVPYRALETHALPERALRAVEPPVGVGVSIWPESPLRVEAGLKLRPELGVDVLLMVLELA